MKLRVAVHMAAALLEPGDAVALYSGGREQGMAVVASRPEKDEFCADGELAFDTTFGRMRLNGDDEVNVKAFGGFRELGKQGARKMTWSAILDPTPLMLEETERGLPRAARAYLIRLRSEDGFAADLKRRKAIEAVLWHYGHGGIAPSHFVQAMLEMFDKADSENFTRLAIGFPDYALAVWLAKNTPAGCEDLKATLRVADLMTEVNKLANQPGQDELERAEAAGEVAARIALGNLDGDESCSSTEPHGRHIWRFQDGDYLCRGAIPYEERVHTPHHGPTDKACHPEPDPLVRPNRQCDRKWTHGEHEWSVGPDAYICEGHR